MSCDLVAVGTHNNEAPSSSFDPFFVTNYSLKPSPSGVAAVSLIILNFFHRRYPLRHLTGLDGATTLNPFRFERGLCHLLGFTRYIYPKSGGAFPEAAVGAGGGCFDFSTYVQQ